jgi:hypothetical protein
VSSTPPRLPAAALASGRAAWLLATDCESRGGRNGMTTVGNRETAPRLAGRPTGRVAAYAGERRGERSQPGRPTETVGTGRRGDGRAVPKRERPQVAFRSAWTLRIAGEP